MSFPSVCLPRVTMHSSVSDVEHVFNQSFDDYIVKRIDVKNVTDRNGTKFQMMFVHFDQDKVSNEFAIEFFQRLEEEKCLHMMTGYKDHFWKVYKNTSEKKEFTPIRAGTLKPRSETVKKVPKAEEPTEEPKVEPKAETADKGSKSLHKLVQEMETKVEPKKEEKINWAEEMDNTAF